MMEKVNIAILGCAIYWIGATWHYQPYHHPHGVTDYLQSTTMLQHQQQIRLILTSVAKKQSTMHAMTALGIINPPTILKVSQNTCKVQQSAKFW